MKTSPIEIGGSVFVKKNVILAPLAGITDFPFRETARMCGAELTFTEMVSANGLVFGNLKTLFMISRLPEEQPIAVQIFGSQPEIMADAAVVCQEMGATLIDINMGCPEKKVIKTGAGAALMLQPETAEKIVREVASRVCVPVTCKIRLGWSRSDLNAPAFARRMEEAGASMITVHARTRNQMFSGRADWKEISRVKEAVSIPVIANGDVCSAADAKRCLKASKSDGIMVGRGAMGRPWTVGNISASLAGTREIAPHGPAKKLEVILFHLDTIENFYDKQVAVKSARKHLAWYSRGMRNSAAFRDRLFKVGGINELKNLAASLFNATS